MVIGRPPRMLRAIAIPGVALAGRGLFFAGILQESAAGGGMSGHSTMNRREALRLICCTPALGVAACSNAPVMPDDDFIADRLRAGHIPGMAACIIRDGTVVWSRGYGWANLETRQPMSTALLMNVASISKTVTTTALMQQWEQGRFGLDDDVNAYLPFPVRNGRHPAVAITFRQLLTHKSSIADGRAYADGYACGDPRRSLAQWMAEYFDAGQAGAAADNFHPWQPGEKEAYCNVAFGMLGYLVETISKVPFAEYCRRHIFDPLGMPRTSWFLAGTDPALQIVPYTWVTGERARGPAWGGQPQGAIQENGPNAGRGMGEGYLRNCLYSHPNLPDGFLRSSVDELAHYLIAHAGNGRYRNARLLAPETVQALFTEDLCWEDARLPDGDAIWGATGHDPGVNTVMFHRPSNRTAVIFFMNTYLGRDQHISDEIVHYLFARATGF